MFDFCLQGYEFKIGHISSDENISDYSRRHPLAQPQENNQYQEYISFVYKNACPKALTVGNIKKVTENNKMSQKFKYLILEDRCLETQK